MKAKICHITTVHPRYDVRIFHKECKSLAKAGYDVHLIVADGKGDEIKDGITIHDIGKPSGRKERVLKFGKRALQKALEIDPLSYHFHDPELIPIGLKLKRKGKRVIYDAHESVPDQLRYKPYLNKPVRIAVSYGFKLYEHYAVARFDAVITVVPQIAARLKRHNPAVFLVRNFPSKAEFGQTALWENRQNHLCYLGAIHRAKGIIRLVRALEKLDTTLHLAGKFEDEALEKQLKSMPGWKKVKYYGVVDRYRVLEILNSVKIGVVLFEPVKNYLHSLPLKMFEYFGAGLAVVASDFPFWREITGNTDAVLWTDPLDTDKIVENIRLLLENDELARTAGQEGRKLVMQRLNWENEEKTLLSVYETILQ